MTRTVSYPVRSHTILDSEIGNRSVTGSSIVEVKKTVELSTFCRKILLPPYLNSTDKYRTKPVENNNDSQMHKMIARNCKEFVKNSNLDHSLSSVPMLIATV